MSNTNINCSIADTIIGYLSSDQNLNIGFFTPTYDNGFDPKANIDANINTDGIGGFNNGVNSDGHGSIIFPSSMTKARLTLPDLTIDSQSVWIGDGTVYITGGVANHSYIARVTLDFRLVVVDGDDTELANVSYGSEQFSVTDSSFGGSSIGFDDPTLSPATSTVDITLGSNKNISFKIHIDENSTFGRVNGQLA